MLHKADEQTFADQKVQRVGSHATSTFRNDATASLRQRERQVVRELLQSILAGRPPMEIAGIALRRLHGLVPADQVSVVALDVGARRATFLAVFDGDELTMREGWQLSSEQLERVRVLQSGELQRITHAPNLLGLGLHPTAEGTTRWPLIIDFPLMAEDTLVGGLTIVSRSPWAFASDHEEIVGDIAAQLAVAIQNASLVEQVAAARKQLRSLSLRLIDVQESERRFMAHELHDEIGQLLTGLKLTLEFPGQAAADPPTGNTAEAISLVNELMNRVRQLSLNLRPQVLDDLGLVPALDWFFKRYFKQTGIRIEFRHTPGGARLPSRLETAAFRIVQEALTNIARHAEVGEATVRLWQDKSHLRVQVEDRGVGFDVESAVAGHTSTGVAGMRERALMLGGEFTIESQPGDGARLTVELPLPESAPVPSPKNGDAS